MFERSSPLWRWCLAIAIGALISGCGGDDPDKRLASAKAYLDKGELRSAVIELKTVLQKQPDREEARFLLGRALLDSEDPVGAAVEFRKALDLGYSAPAVTPLLARALLEQGQVAEVILQFGSVKLEDKAAQASVLTSVALALAQSGQIAKAEATLNQALEAMPGHGPAQVALARLAASKGDFGAALQKLESVISSGSASPDAWSLQGDLLAQSAKDHAAALAAYRKALAVDAKHVTAHAGVIRLLLAANDLDAATAQVAELNKVRPGHPMARLFAAQLAFERRDYKAAREAIQHVLKAAPNHPMANQLAGAIELAAGSTAVARSHLSKTLQAAPGNAAARRMLGAAILRAGDTDKALEVLEPLLSAPTPDPLALALAGEAQMQAGRLDAAADLFARSGKAQPNNPVTQTALARTKFLKGDATGAIADLERIAASDAGASADLELVNAQLRRRDARAALRAIDGLERKLPGKPLPLHLRGTAHLQLKDDEKARAAFDKALGMDASYFPAAVSLASMDLSAGRLQPAQERMEEYLKAHPGHVHATLALVEVKVRQKAPAQHVVDLLTKAVQINPADAALRVRLIEYHLFDKKVDAAVAAAQQADAALPNQPRILEALGQAQLAAGQQSQAMATFNKILSIQPKSVSAHLRVADANVATKNSKAAVQALKRAISTQPDAPVLYQRLFVLLVQEGSLTDALQLARDVQKRQPAHSLGWVLEGDALRAQKNNDAALAAYKTGSAKVAPTDAAVRYHALLAATGKQAEAERFALSWERERPKDLGFVLYRADAALARRDLQRAEALYGQVLAGHPDNVRALNNAAWLMVKLNKPGGVALAERANQLAPEQPALMDTLAMALAFDKRLEPAIELQKRALALRPGSGVLKLGLARLYLQAGKKSEAKELLDPLAQLGDAFAEHDEVKSLLAGI